MKGRTLTEVFFAAFDEKNFEPFEVGLVQWLRKPGENDNESLSAGFWKVSPEDAPDPFDLSIEQNETIYIVSGHLRIEIDDGRTLEMLPGTAASLSIGALTRWTVVEPTIEFFVYS